MKLNDVILLGAVLTLSMSCSQPETGGVARRDSLGVAIVESTRPAWVPHEAWTVEPSPILDLATSGTDAAHEFYRVEDALRLSDGTVVVANRGSGEVRAFTPQGATSWTVGRQGEGPGEFRRLSQLARFRGDSLIAFDYWLGRATVIEKSGAAARILPPFSLALRLQELFVLTDTTFAAAVYPSNPLMGMDAGLYRMSQHAIRLSAETGALIDTIIAFPGFEGVIVTMGDMAPLFGKRGHVAVRHGYLLVGTADSMEYRRYDDAGMLQEIVRVPGYDLSLAEPEIDRERAARAPPGMNIRSETRDAVASLPRPKTRPAYANMLVDADGNVWLAEHHGFVDLDEATDWEVFAAHGAWLGTVRTPPRFAVHEIGTDYVLGTWRDAVDVEHVQLLQLTR